MTKLWGPLGWMTLHSISLNYPDNPSPADKGLVKQFIDEYAQCITCPSCKNHFTGLFHTYIQRYRNWADSKFDLFLFVVRAHNSVNKRLDKPILQSVADCLETIKSNTRDTSLREFRQKYITYLFQNWAAFKTGEGFIMVGAAKNLQRINNEYWNLREVDLASIKFPEEDVTTPISDNTLTPRISSSIPQFHKGMNISVGFRIKGGRLQLGSR